MKYRHIYGFIRTVSLLLGLVLMSSCLEKENATTDKGIHLKASLLPNYVVTRGEGVLDPTYNQNLQIGITRIDEGPGSSYPYFNGAKEQLIATMKPGNPNTNIRDISFDDSYQHFNDASSNIKYASWYPYAENSFNPTTHSVTTPIDGNTDIMYGSIATGNQRTGFNTIYFNHALCKFTFYVYAMVQKETTQQELNDMWGQLKDIKLKGLPKDCVITLPDKKEDEYRISYTGISSDNEVSVPKESPDGPLLAQLPIGQASAKKLRSLITAPPQDGLLNVLVETGIAGTNKVSPKTMTIARNFKPGRNYDIYLRFSDHGLINAEVSVGEWLEGNDIMNDHVNNEIYYDLSTAEHANCYVVTSANYSYCFDVNTVGNGANGAIGTYPTSLKTNYIDVLWMTEGMEKYFSLDNHLPVQHRALFTVKNDKSVKEETDRSDKTLSKKGNVLIGAYDKDPAEGGHLLWTWHIWLTDKPKDQAYKNGFVVMDRDLGALAYDVDLQADADKIDGLYYQWGRPTPLPLRRPAVKPAATTGEGNDPTTEKVTVKNDPTASDMMTRIQHPLTFYTNATAIQNLTEFKQYWGFNLNTLEYTKTIFDPCPPGYRLPSKSMFSHMANFNVTFTGKAHQHSITSTVDSYYTMNNALSGYYTDADHSIGYYDGTGLTAVDAGAYLWTGSLNLEEQPSDGFSPNSLDCKLSDASATPPTVNTGTIEARNPTNALPVRCVSVRSVPEVTNLSDYQTANSYIISKDGYYKFDATVRGNGINKLVSPGSTQEIDISSGMSANIAQDAYRIVPLWWQGDLSQNNGNTDPDTTPIPIEFIDDGKISPEGEAYFYIRNFRKGNLIVAAVDHFDNILWSWHLWLTDKPAIHKSYDYAVMDRFLGATTCPTDINVTKKETKGSWGFYYQWGRKDPFPGPAGFGDKNGNTNNSSKWWQYDESMPAGQRWEEKNTIENNTSDFDQKTVQKSVTHPTRFHKAFDKEIYYDRYNGDHYKDYIPRSVDFRLSDSYDDPDYQTYSDTPTIESMWGYSAVEKGFGKTTSKTMYDPCPPGYSAAYYLIWRSSDLKGIDIYITANPGLIDASNSGIADVSADPAFGIFLNRADFDHTWFPFCGYLDFYDVTYKQVGKVGRFYTSTPKEKTCRSMAYWRDENNGHIITSQALDTNNKGLPTSFGFPVRCQKD